MKKIFFFLLLLLIHLLAWDYEMNVFKVLKLSEYLYKYLDIHYYIKMSSSTPLYTHNELHFIIYKYVFFLLSVVVSMTCI